MHAKSNCSHVLFIGSAEGCITISHMSRSGCRWVNNNTVSNSNCNSKSCKNRKRKSSRHCTSTSSSSKYKNNKNNHNNNKYRNHSNSMMYSNRKDIVVLNNSMELE